MNNAITKHLGSSLIEIVLTFLFGISVLFFSFTFVNAQYVRDMNYKADQALKSNARVNPSTLAMELSIPIGGYPGRAGNSLPLMFNYSSKVWQIKSLNSWDSWNGVKTDTRPMYGKRSAAGWTSNLGTPRIDFQNPVYDGWYDGAQYEGQIHSDYVPTEPPPNPPVIPFYYVKRLQVTMPDGSTHEFRVDDTNILCGSSQSGCPMDLNGTYLSVDGSKMRLEISQSNRVLFMPDGSRYLFGSGDTATTYIDRHGNKMTYDVANKRWTDTLGRIIDDPMPFNWNDFQQNQVVEDKVASFPSIDGGTTNVTLSWRYLKDPQGGESGLENISQDLHNLSDVGCQGNVNRDLTGPYLFNNSEPSISRVCHPISWVGLNWTQGPPFNPVVLTRITLPNGQTYEFKYNVYGEITKIIYPTGAYERFQYGAAPSVQPNGGVYDQANRGVTDRWASARGDGTDEIHWTHEGWQTTAPDGTKTLQFLVAESFDAPQPFGFGNALTGMPYEERILSPSNQILRRKLTDFEVTGPQPGGYSTASRDARPTKEISIIFEPGATQALAMMTETVYDTHNDPQYFAQLNPKEVKTYNYIVLDLGTAQTGTVSQIAALFNASTLVTITEMVYLYDTNYKARNLTSLPIETRIKDVNGNIKAKGQIVYDEGGYSLLSTGSMPTSAANSWIDPLVELGGVLGNKRGLPTTVRSYSDISLSQYIETHSFFDQFGNARKVRDGRGNDSETEFADTYAFAYPTLVRTAIPDPSGQNGSNTAFTMTTVYDLNTGLTTSTTDANGQTTQISYADPTTGVIDPLLRIRKITAPTGQQTLNEFGGGATALTRWVKIRTQIDADKWKESYIWYDGLNRTVKTQSVDSAGDIFVETEYDNVGRPKKVTNPYRAGETIYWTETFYDDLDRITKVKTQDNAEVNSAYGLATTGLQIGTVVTVTDQAGKQRRSITNGLGQLKRVDEPTDASGLGPFDNPNQYTLYSYDPLNNLTEVDQGVQTRAYVYDALSRLKQVSNPENGTINYTHDANGNILSKTDARSITTSYIYDNLNRVKTRSYSDSTPGVSYFYDNLPNAKGQVIKIDSSVSTTEYLAFDILGRVLSHKQTTDGSGYTTGYVYNLSGALIEETYPSSRVVKNVLDNDGDLSIVQSRRTANHGFFNYAKSFIYNSAGAVVSMQLGNGRWESMQFNSRMQPTQIALGTVQNGSDKLKLDYNYGNTNNSGNILSQTVTVPTVGTNEGFTAVQNFTYDSLNRVKDAQETISGIETWKQTFNYDRYGNRTFDTASNNTTTLLAGCPTNVCNPAANQANNRLIGHQFDGSGNATADAENRTFVYDAENRQVEVRDSLNNIIGQYKFDGDGKRVKKYVPSTGETTIFVYNASGKLVAEYSTVIASQQEAKVGYLTNDHLGSPRINTDQNGSITARHDYHPFGEEIVTSHRTAGLGYTSDSVRKQFAGYEKDGETGLDFAQARMYANGLGRFTTTDPIYFQRDMVVDPQRFNLYVYTRNNPLKWIDPDGEKVKVARGSSLEELYQLVGGKENFEKYFQVGADGMVTLRDGVSISGANQGVQFLNQLIDRPQTFLVYLGADADAVAKLFAGTTNPDGSLNKKGEKIRDRFLSDGSIVGTSGRPLAEQPEGDIFTVLAINPAAYNYNQIGVGNFGVETSALQTGIGQRVRAVSLLIHELAENLDFSINGTGAGHPAPDKKLLKKKATKALYQQQYNLHIGGVDYARAHTYAIRREVQIRGDLTTINGGYAGGQLQKQTNKK